MARNKRVPQPSAHIRAQRPHLAPDAGLIKVTH
jgi:hypothetical protein